MMADEKARLREQFRRDRRERVRSVTFDLLLATPEIASAKIVASYISYGTEPSTQALNQSLLAKGLTLILPRLDENGIEWVTWDGKPENLKLAGRIQEPIGPEFSDLAAVDVVIVPALQIDTDGYRLGKGGGYYDRALPTMSGWKVGLIYSGELTSDILPRENHDVALSAAATPDEVVRF